MERNEALVPYLYKWVPQFVKEHGRAELDKRLMDALFKFIQEDYVFASEEIEGDSTGYYSDWFHLSSALDCARKSWFSRLKFPAKAKSSTDLMKEWLIFSNGDAGHMRWQCLLEAAGLLKGRESTASFVSEELRVRGKADGIFVLPDGVRRLFEFKTANSRSFSLVKKNDMPFDAHVVQANGYMHFLKLPRASIVYECKDNHEVIEFNIAYDEDLFKWTVEKRILPQTLAVKTLKLPVREGKGIDTAPCKWCQFIPICFSTHNYNAAFSKVKARIDKAKPDARKKEKSTKKTLTFKRRNFGG